MNQCKLCHDNIYNGTLYHYLFTNDIICYKCRKLWNYKPTTIKRYNIKIRSYYTYESTRHAIIQYKECYDESLYDIFLYRILWDIKLRYIGYTIILAPSSNKALNERGFNHLYLIFKCLNMPILDVLYKISNKQQKTNNYQDRKEIINDIKIKKDIVLPKKILVVDDIVTSGGTILAIKECLKDYNIKIKYLTLIY